MPVWYPKNVNIQGRNPTFSSTRGLLTTPTNKFINYNEFVNGIQLRIVSSNANDNLPSATGARKVRLRGIILTANDTPEYHEEVVTMNGIAPVLTTQTRWVRLLSAEVVESGALQSQSGTFMPPTGTISITNIAATSTYMQILPAIPMTETAVFTVLGHPNTYAIINNITISTGAIGGAKFDVRYRPITTFTAPETSAFTVISSLIVAQNTSITLTDKIIIPSYGDVEVSGVALGGGTSFANFSCNLTLL